MKTMLQFRYLLGACDRINGRTDVEHGEYAGEGKEYRGVCKDLSRAYSRKRREKEKGDGAVSWAKAFRKPRLGIRDSCTHRLPNPKDMYDKSGSGG